MYYLVVFWFGSALITGLILGKNFFFNLIERTTSLLDAMLSDEADEVKQQLLIQRLSKLVVTLLKLIGIVTAIIIVSLAPGYLYLELSNLQFQSMDSDSWLFYTILIGSSTLPFLVMLIISKKKDYSDWSILFHRIIFNNRNLSRGLFKLEKSLYSSKLKDKAAGDFLIISGLARAGTTALTTVLYESGQFHSLSYANMPLLLSPNLWRIFYKPRNSALRERSHGDRVMFGHNTVEALEEFFWMVHLKNSYVSSDVLRQHAVAPEIYQQYLTYQGLLQLSSADNTRYLAKNNNFILRYESIRKLNDRFVMVLLFRDPIEHAASLLHQHKRYSKFQQEDAFVREYMGWLGHFEFGLDQRSFDFTAPELVHQGDKFSIDYWLRVWIGYYQFILQLSDDPRRILLDYQDLLNKPEAVVKTIGDSLGLNRNTHSIKKFENQKSIEFDGDMTLRDHAYSVHEKLLVKKTKI